MINSGNLAIWELFLGEICRNIKPEKEDIRESLGFLLRKKACSNERFEAIVSVRYMAAYEQTINEYLHPPLDFKQANIKAELIHFGSLFEGLSEILLVNLYKNKNFTLDDYNSWFSNGKVQDLLIKNDQLLKRTKKRAMTFTFKGIIDCLSHWNKVFNAENEDFADFLKVIDMLRIERNSVHINQMINTSIYREEYKLVEVREKWIKFVQLIEKQI